MLAFFSARCLGYPQYITCKITIYANFCALDYICTAHGKNGHDDAGSKVGEKTKKRFVMKY